jgi:GNAT superfamily N-acetyltransferase
MAHVHVETWRTTYRGIVPDAALDRMTVDNDIESGFGSWLAEPPPGVAQFVVENPGEGVVGFALGGPNAEKDPGLDGELGALYVLRSHQGRGIGTALMREVARHLVGTGRSGMIVWVLEQNPYRRFYERSGGVPVRRRMWTSRRAGIPLPEISYGWTDLRSLAGP